MAEFIQSFEEMVEEAKREGRYHEGSIAGNFGLTFDEAVAVRMKYFERSQRIEKDSKSPIKCV
ncbi:hypothetical protein [[Flexibacter] sp. ATCC 35208]|uniref:hypothetical protein n=1 Tax=[Flexibacter] sp. ATCC 35208 TaxID=1936242 RepID=UPI0009CD4AFC|nr:hypothetical protein [[Flexibacter] sp. ATCC 35208]OMP79195.1 hypothetical protein BW716_11330 [[Flexibacter] sp. ATCC 35208]